MRFAETYIKAVQLGDFDRVQEFHRLLKTLSNHVDNGEMTSDEMKEVIDEWIERLTSNGLKTEL